MKALSSQHRLEGALGYCMYVLEQIENGSVSSLEKLKEKLSQDGERAAGALAHHYEKQLQVTGVASNFIADAKPLIAET